MDYQRLSVSLDRLGRERGYYYVCDSYRPELRKDPQYRKWKRVCNAVALRAMDPRLRAILNSGLLLKTAASVAACSSRPLEQTPFGRRLAEAEE